MSRGHSHSHLWIDKGGCGWPWRGGLGFFMDDKILHLLLKYGKKIVCKGCDKDLLRVGLVAKSIHTLSIPDKNEDIEIKCPVCKTDNVFTKKECINKKVECLKCNKVLGETYPGMPSNINPLGKDTRFYKLKITCPNPNCSKVNEFYI